ncbi:phosphoribosylglycinamide formyltransferase [Ferrovibrio sp.]|uniref:phosphoribosylglycinamide formyltransferase n=1 Tax=Ferrovibrio sp. TaxID=1917215 RepID=UPI0025C64D73|nr:phosphoribosylglycinamide formyltransferase [Ferrovibrio sp.]
MTAVKRAVAVLISGRGTNLRALIESTLAADHPARIALVLSNKAEAEGLEIAKAAGIETALIESRGKERAVFDAEMDALLKAKGIEYICLAGFMRLLTTEFVQAWYGRMINIHPSLLPAFRGTDVHARVIESGARFSGCTVHFVSPEVDAGPIILQAAVPVPQDATAESLAAAVLEQEHALYPQALRLLTEGRLVIEGQRVRVKN